MQKTNPTFSPVDWTRALRPAHLRRQRHEDRLPIATGPQTEFGAAIINQVELGIASAPHQLFVLFRCRPRLVHGGAQDGRIGRKKGKAGVAREREILIPVLLQIIKKDAPYAAGLAAVLDEEIFVAPFREAVVIACPMRVAGALEFGVESQSVGMIWPALLHEHRGQIAAASEPGFLRHDMARIEMGRWHARIVHMRHERDSTAPIARVGLRARNLLGELGLEGSVYGGNVDANLLEHAPLHQRHGAAAAVAAVGHGPLPILAYKAPRWTVGRAP